MLSDLIERVEKLTGPDRKADALIEVAVRRFDAFRVGLTEESRAKWKAVGQRGEVADEWTRYYSPEYTRSLDAAIALTERLLPGWMWSMMVGLGRASVFVRDKTLLDPTKIERDGYSTSPAIALVLATLRAYAATHPAEVGK